MCDEATHIVFHVPMDIIEQNTPDAYGGIKRVEVVDQHHLLLQASIYQQISRNVSPLCHSHEDVKYAIDDACLKCILIISMPHSIMALLF